MGATEQIQRQTMGHVKRYIFATILVAPYRPNPPLQWHILKVNTFNTIRRFRVSLPLLACGSRMTMG